MKQEHKTGVRKRKRGSSELHKMSLLYLWHTGTFAAVFQQGNPIQRTGFTVTYSHKQVINALSPSHFLAKTSDLLPPCALLLPNQEGRQQLPCCIFFTWSFGLMLSTTPASLVTHRLHVSCASSDFLLTLLVLSTVTVCWFSTARLIIEIGC